MEVPITYTYDGQLWTPSPTVSDRDSFFHSAFGVRTDENEPYFDKQAKFKRMRWSAFLTYFENESIPSCLADTLKKCFSAHNKYKDVSVEDKNQFARYVYDIMFSDESVTVEEIPVIATLENIKVTILCDSVRPATVVKPNIELLGSYSNSVERPKKVVLSLQGNVFSRLEPMHESTTKPDRSVKTVENKNLEGNVQGLKDSSVKYEKGGSAGSKGVEFQVSLLSVFLLNAMVKRLTDWRLSSENKKAGKFDDVVLECSEGDVLLQAKYRENRTKKITLEDLMSVNSKNDEFSLPKYFLSYQEIKDTFKIKSVLICTNTSLHCTALKFIKSQKICPQNMLHHEGGICSFHTFKREILPRLKENVKIYFEKNVKKKDVDVTVITDENLQDFLNRLHFYSDFPAGSGLEKVMEQLLSRMNLHRQTTYLEVYAKVMNWFHQKSGVYLNETLAKAIFLEIWRDKYWQVLEQYKVYFQNNDLDFQQSSRLIHIPTDDGYFLQELRLYRALKDKEKVLYLHCDDSLDIRNQVIESFRLPQYVFLIIIWPKFESEEESTRSISEELQEILRKYEYKRVIVVTKQNSKMIAEIRDDPTITRGSVSFEDFSKDTQKRLLNRKNIVFQGRCVSLEELFANQVIEDYSKALNSELLEKIVKDEKITVGLPLLGLDKNTSRFYITRQFKMRIKENERKKWEFSTSEENLSEENIFDINNKLILISDIAGMGKSTTLTNLATAIKEKYPDLWVIRIQLTAYTAILKTLLENNNTKTTNVINLLNSKPATEFTNQLERFVFTLQEKVVLMLDGIDEISPDYTDLVLNMIIECQEATNFTKIFVTTRPHTANDLQIRLGVKPFVLQPFSEENQVQFFTSYWKHNLELDDKDKERCEQYARALISRMFTWMKVYEGENNFPGVPLQARMLAEIFQENNGWTEPLDWEGCREYLNTNKEEPKLPEGINITKLYEMFIEKKRKIFMDKGNPSGNTVANQALDDKFNESLSNHRNIALEMILDKDRCKFFSSYRMCGEDSGTNLVKIGIVQKVNREFYFIHRTFAEYFVAVSLLKELHNQNLEFQKFFIDEVLLNLEYSMICAFFDNFLHNIVESLPSTTFQHYQSLKDHINLNERYKSNLIFRLAEEGYIATLQLFFKCIDFKIITDKEVLVTDLYETDFDPKDFDNRRHIFSNTLNMLQYFVSQGGVNIKNEEGKTPLHLASQRGHLQMVKYLINQGASIECRDCDGHTPLHCAVYYSHFDVTKFLVEQGANINSRDNNGRTIPHESVIGSQVNIASYLLDNILKDGLDVKNSMIPYMAAFLGRLNILQMLIEKDLDVNCLLEGDETLITVAALGNQLDTIKYLIDQGADINLTDSEGNTALHVAALEGQLDIVRFLVLKCGIDVNVRNHFIGTPLNLAILSGHLDTIKFLIKHGANVHIRDNYDETVLHLASLMGKWDIVRFLVVDVGFRIDVTNKNGCTPLHLAVSKSQLDIVKFFVTQGADINARDNSGRTALHSVIRTGRLDTVKVLVGDYKANIYMRDKDGKTALHLAAQQGELLILEFLIRCGANIHITDNAGLTAVHLAASEGKLEVVKLFLNLGMDVNVRDRNGRTLLHTAASWNRLETIKFIVTCDVDINAIDDGKKTALHLASESGRMDTVRFLVENGASVCLKDDGDCTALHLAASNGHLSVVKFLAEHGADINIAENSGRTALHLAALKNHLNIVEFLVDRGVNMDAKDKEGCSALKLADSRANRHITVYLVECGADVNALLSIFD